MKPRNHKQAPVVDDLDDAAQATLVQLGCRGTRERSIAQKHGAVVGALSAGQSNFPHLQKMPTFAPLLGS